MRAAASATVSDGTAVTGSVLITSDTVRTATPSAIPTSPVARPQTTGPPSRAVLAGDSEKVHPLVTHWPRRRRPCVTSVPYRPTHGTCRAVAADVGYDGSGCERSGAVRSTAGRAVRRRRPHGAPGDQRPASGGSLISKPPPSAAN